MKVCVTTASVSPSSKAPSSLKSHACVAILPSSVEVEVNVTSSPTFGSAGEIVKLATGARLPTVTSFDTVATAPLLSTTRSLTV